MRRSPRFDWTQRTDGEDVPMESNLTGNYLVVGANGGVGKVVTASLEQRGCTVTGIDLPDTDLRLPGVVAERVETLWRDYGPFDGLVLSCRSRARDYRATLRHSFGCQC
jgi:nucleoside-diphosphate-sugar epimerase